MSKECYKCAVGISHIFHDDGTRTSEATPKSMMAPGYAEIDYDAPKPRKVIGFSGARSGMTKQQKFRFRHTMQGAFDMFEVEFHHGDCIGADHEAHNIVRDLNPDAYVVIHPPIDPKARAFMDYDELDEPAGYLERNRAIVAASDVLIITPTTNHEILRSGTWATARYAFNAAKPVYICEPEGGARKWDRS